MSEGAGQFNPEEQGQAAENFHFEAEQYQHESKRAEAAKEKPASSAEYLPSAEEDQRYEQQLLDEIRQELDGRNIRLRIAKELSRSSQNWFNLFNTDLMVASVRIGMLVDTYPEMRYRIAGHLLKAMTAKVKEMQSANDFYDYDPEIPPKDVREALIDGLDHIAKITLGEEVAEPHKK